MNRSTTRTPVPAIYADLVTDEIDVPATTAVRDETFTAVDAANDAIVNAEAKIAAVRLDPKAGGRDLRDAQATLELVTGRAAVAEQTARTADGRLSRTLGAAARTDEAGRRIRHRLDTRNDEHVAPIRHVAAELCTRMTNLQAADAETVDAHRRAVEGVGGFVGEVRPTPLDGAVALIAQLVDAAEGLPNEVLHSIALSVNKNDHHRDLPAWTWTPGDLAPQDVAKVTGRLDGRVATRWLATDKDA